MESLLNLDEEENEMPNRADWFLKKAIDLMVEAFKNWKGEEADNCRKASEELSEEEAGTEESETSLPEMSASVVDSTRGVMMGGYPSVSRTGRRGCLQSLRKGGPVA